MNNIVATDRCWLLLQSASSTARSSAKLQQASMMQLTCCMYDIKQIHQSKHAAKCEKATKQHQLNPVQHKLGKFCICRPTICTAVIDED